MSRAWKQRVANVVLLALTLVSLVVALISGRFALQSYERSLLSQLPAVPAIDGPQRSPVVFIGDSRVSDWSANDGLNARYVGFPGATVAQIERGMQGVELAENLSAVVIQAGVNDLKLLGIRPDVLEKRVSVSFADLIRLVDSMRPRADRVVLMHVLPVGEPELLRTLVWSDAIGEGVRRVNELIADHAWPDGVVTVDPAALFEHPDADLFTDALHFTPVAYSRLNPLISTAVFQDRG